MSMSLEALLRATEPPLTKERELELLALRPDQWATDRLVLSNVPYIINIAKKYQNRGVELEDLTSVAVMGMIRGVNLWDSEYGVRLMTYATYWVVNYLEDATATLGHAVRVPKHVLGELYKVRAGGETDSPYVEEAAKAISRDTVDVYAADIEAVETHQLYNAEELLVLRTGLAALPERLRTVVQLRFFDGMSLTETGAVLGVCKERVRQLESRAMEQLRAGMGVGT